MVIAVLDLATVCAEATPLMLQVLMDSGRHNLINTTVSRSAYPSNLSARICNTLTPAQVSDGADRRLWILALWVALAERERRRKRCTAHLFNILVETYRTWDPCGFKEITEDGLTQAMNILSL